MSRLLLSGKVRAEGSSRGPAGFTKAAKKENKQKKGGKNTRHPLKCILGTLWGRRNAEGKYKSHLKAFESKVHCDAVGTGTDQRHEMSKTSC